MSQGASKTAGTKTDILLESGTNELEVLVFGLGEGVFGVNVAKVREVIMPVEVSPAPEQGEEILGMFNLRGRLLPLIDLHRYMNVSPRSDDPKARRIIVMEFNGVQSAFQVDLVEQIYRMSWKAMRSVPDSGGASPFCITGITEINERLVLMLDFESIIDHISFTDEYHIDQVPNETGVQRDRYRIIVAEDSNFIRSIMMRVLRNSGYIHISEFTNGMSAYEMLKAPEFAEQPVDLVITDIEMPQMDGLALTRHIKEDPALKHIPVLLFSSLITEDTRHKGKQVGADEQLAKPQLPELVQHVDRWLNTKKPAAPA